MRSSKAQQRLEKESLNSRKSILFYAVVAMSIVGIFAFSQIGSCYGDEGFHLLAAQLIMAGKKPYIDFFYQHPPLHIYVTAAWMSVFGDNWRSAHFLSALFTSGCVVTMANYLWNRWRGQTNGLETAITATLILAFNYFVIAYGTFGQPYSFCLLFSAISFRLTLKSEQSRSLFFPILAGLFAGAAAASSFLALPIAPALLVWMIARTKNGSRLPRALGFVCGAMVLFLPLLILFARAPRQIFLDVFQYHFLYRDPGSNQSNFFWNLKTIAKLIVESYGPLVLLAALGWIRLRRNSDIDSSDHRAELQLCFWLVVCLAVYLSLPLPTFATYYVLLVPFVVVLASEGIHLISINSGSARLSWLILAFVILISINLQGSYGEVLATRGCWQSIQDTAARINAVTPSNGLVFGREQFYFVSRHQPPPGLENSFGIDNLPPKLQPLSHAATSSQIDEWLGSSYFDSVIIGADDPRVMRLNLLSVYPRKETMPVHRATFYLLSKR